MLRCVPQCLLIVAVFSMLTVDAVAQDDVAIEQAERLVDRGRDAFSEGDFESAAIFFQEAFNLDPHPVLLFNIARTHEEMGELPAALSFYQRVLRMEPNPQVAAATNARIEELSTELERQGYDPATVTMDTWVPRGSLAVETTPDGARVFINDEFVGRTPYEVPRMNQGTYDLRLALEDHQPIRQQFEVSGGETTIIRHELERRTTLEEYTPPEPATLRVVAPERGLSVYIEGRRVGTTPLEGYELSPGRYRVAVEQEGWTTWEDTISVASSAEVSLEADVQRTGRRYEREGLSRDQLSTVLLIGGGAVLATGATFGLLAYGDSRRYSNRPDDPSRASWADRADRRALAGDIMMAVGAVTAGTGLVLRLTGGRDDDVEIQRDLVLAPTAVHGGGAIELKGRFR